MLPENHSFFIRGEDGQEYGPVDLDELRDWVRENRAGLGTEVRLDEPGAPWHPWQNYPELVALLAEVHVTSPVPGQPGLVIAPLGRRILAFGLDLVLISILVTPIFLTLALVCLPDWFVQYVVATSQPPFTPPDLPLDGKVVANLISDVILALYFTGFHAAHGQTPAKALLRLRVVDQSGRKPNPVKAFLRSLALIFSMSLLFLPLTYAFLNPQRRALHDFIAGTYVVKA
jgi:uncharacterized RDD family membrane protein YckC